jgi:hypothetical protein
MTQRGQTIFLMNNFTDIKNTSSRSYCLIGALMIPLFTPITYQYPEGYVSGGSFLADVPKGRKAFVWSMKIKASYLDRIIEGT